MMKRARTNGERPTATRRRKTKPAESSGRPRLLRSEPLEDRLLLAVSVVHRVNAGGSLVASTPAWLADAEGAPSQYVNGAATGDYVSTTTATINISHPSIPAGTPQALFKSDRWDPAGGPELQWAFPVTAGQYQVRLYFAEIYAGGHSVGARTFDVSIENTLVLNDYDVFAEVGGNAGVVKTFTVTSDATLNINFAHVVDNPSIKAIEILTTDTPTSGVLGSSANNLGFGTVTVGSSGQQSLTLTNTGSAGASNITITGTTITGTNPAQFSDSFTDATPVVLAPGQSTTFNVNFNPTTAGSRSANLQISHSGTNTPLSIPLAGTAVANQAPVIAAITNPTLTAGASQTLSVSATDPDGPASGIVLSASGLPAFASFTNQGNGLGQFSFSPPVGTTGTFPITLTAADSATPSATSSKAFTLTVTAPPVGGTVVYRINAGGSQVSGTPAWLADAEGAPSQYGNGAATGDNTFSTTAAINLSHPSIPAGTPQSIFQSERWDNTGGPELQWAFPVTAGQYQVRLYFAETYFGAFAVGSRTFDVTIENALVLNDYDVYAEVGGNAGVVKSFTVTSDATLNINFAHVVENPAIKAIEIIQAGSTPNQLAASSSVVNFDQVTVGQIGTKTFNLTNNGGAGDPSIVINPASAAFLPATPQFTLQFSQTQPITLAPGQSTTVTVKYTPTSVTSNSATLSIPHSGTNSPLTISIVGQGVSAVPVSFSKSSLIGASSVLPTSLQFGPDGRLYVAEQDGLIKIYTVVRNSANNYQVTATETLTQIQQIPNHDDNGTLNTSVTTRLVTGLLVVGTAANPIVYVTSSDPRIGAGPAGTDLNLDTNSGIVSRLTKNGSSWTKLDIVRGLPRSEENHANNGMQLDTATNTLYLAMGGNTNMGAPSNNFALLPEYALSAAILSIDLTAIGETTYDLPTLNDENRAGVNDANDPFGGNDGKNQARIVPGGPVQVYAPGFRNPYDIVITSAGRMYTIDNGPNAGWGGAPVGEGPAGNATNAVSEPGQSYGDGLHFVTGPGYYGGHPNPTRSNPANTFNSSNPQSPVSVSNPIESDYLIPGTQNGALIVYPQSTNGLVEYTASNFGGALKGNLLAASFDNSIKRIVLNGTGTSVDLSTNLFNTVGTVPLDVTAQGDFGALPGTIWVADIDSNAIFVFEPADFGSGPVDPPDPNDLDGDGYSNADETANGTDPNNAGDVPPDHDADFLSNKLDADDDNDTQPDVSDPFAIDAQNGQQNPIGTLYTWENDAPRPGGLLNLGFTGLMSNGVSNYESLFDVNKLTAGGAAGVLTIDNASLGTARGATNTQDQAFQFGVNVSGATKPFAGHTRVLAPWSGSTPQAGQQMGFYLGLGDQNNYAQLVLDGNGTVVFEIEINGQMTTVASTPIALAQLTYVDFYLTIDPVSNTVQASYAPFAGGVHAPRTLLGTPAAIPASWLSGVMAVGLISTTPSAQPPLPVTWDFLGVVYDTPRILEASVSALAFGTVSTIGSAQLPVILTNLGQVGDPAITISGTTISGANGAQFSDSFNDAAPVVLQPGQSTTIFVTFSPTSAGAKTAQLSIAHDGVSAPLTISLSGSGSSSAATASAKVTIDPGGTIDDSSTYDSGAFRITNLSTGGQTIQSVRFNLATAFFVDQVFDPNGTAGDPTGKTFTPDSGASQTGQSSFAFSGANGGGFSILDVFFTDFQLNELFTFSVDIDPTSIKGAESPGPSHAGSQSGLELIGSTITVTFSDGSVLVSEPYRVPSSLVASETTLRIDQPSAPQIALVGVASTPVTLTNASQTVRITGTPGSNVALLQVEGGLYLAGVPGGGFDIDPFEANKAIGVVERQAVIGAGGFVDVPVTLLNSSAESGLNHFMAVIVDAQGRSGRMSNVAVVKLQASVPTNQAPVIATITNPTVTAGNSQTMAVSATDPDGPASGITLSASGLPAFVTFTNQGNGQGLFTFTPPVGTTGSFTITVTAVDSGTPQGSSSKTFTLTVNAAPVGGTVVYRVNAGGAQVAGTPAWLADLEGAPSQYSNGVATGDYVSTTTATINMNHASIPAGTPQAVFKSDRWDPAGGSELQWAFPVTAGQYQVRLFFAETYTGAFTVGARKFDVTIEGALLLNDYDVYAEVGGNAGVVKTFTVTSDATLNINFAHVVDNPSIKAIEILSVGSAPAAPAAQSMALVADETLAAPLSEELDAVVSAAPLSAIAAQSQSLQVGSNVAQQSPIDTVIGKLAPQTRAIAILTSVGSRKPAVDDSTSAFSVSSPSQNEVDSRALRMSALKRIFADSRFLAEIRRRGLLD